MSDMTIARFAASAGVGVETVRYYQRRGLMPTPRRPDGGVRRYDAGDVRRLRFIRQAQTAGFTLAQIAELLQLDSGHDHARARALAGSRIAALDARIAELEVARSALVRLTEACAGGEGGPCPIIAAFTGDPVA